MKSKPHYLKEWRVYRDLSGEHLAEKVGLGRQAVWKLENFKKNLVLETILKLAKALDIGPGDMFYPPPTDTRSRLNQRLLNLNEHDLETVAALVDSLSRRSTKQSA